MHERLIGPYVSEDALHKPHGAAVDAAGLVACVSCKQPIPLAKADIVGLGYRCVPCGHKAHVDVLRGSGDAASHFTSSERAGLSATGTQLAMLGGLVILGGGLLVPLGFFKIGGVTVMTGVGMLGMGLARRSASR